MADEGKLIRYSSGMSSVPQRDRKVSKQAKEVYDEVRLRGMQVDGAFVLAGHIMGKAIELDQLRTSLAGDNLVHNQLLADIEATALRQAKGIQQSLFEGWEL